MQSKKGKVRIAIVGFGFMGRMHYGMWKKMKGAEVVALCDKDQSQFKTALKGTNMGGQDSSTDYGKAVIYEDFGKMLAEAKPDAISLTLPTFLHKPLAIQALQAGVSVLCEKPMSLTSADCAAMLKAAAAAPNGAQLMIAQCLRFWPAFAFLKDLIEKGKYGKPLSMSFHRMSPLPGWGKGKCWFCDESRSGGVALDLHIHDSDLVQFLFGMPKSVTSHATYHESGAMQYISTIYDVGNCTVTAEGSWCTSPTAGFEANYTVNFEHATVICDGKRSVPLCIYPEKGKPIVPKLPAGDGYLHEIQWFLDKLRGKAVKPLTTPEESRGSVLIVEAEKKSAKTGKPVKLGGEK